MQHSLKIRRRVNLLNDVWRLVRTAAGALDLPSEDAARQMEMVLHARVLEMTAACVRLFDIGQHAPMPILLRVAYEALVDQIALERNPRYLNHIAAEAARGGRVLPELIRMHGKDTLEAFLSAAGAREALRKLKTDQEQIEQRGGMRQEAEEKFEAAGMHEEYPFYRLLSAEVHNDAGMLIARHVAQDRGGAERLQLFGTPDDVELSSRLNLGAGNLLRSAMSVHRNEGAPFREYFDKVTEFIREDDARQGVSSR